MAHFALTNIKHDKEWIDAGEEITDQLPSDVVDALREQGAIGPLSALGSGSGVDEALAAKDARIAELEAALAAAQGQEQDDANAPA